MRLYGTAGSPFVARVRIQILAKALPVEIVEPPGGVASPQLRELSSLGRIPILESEGIFIPESSVIQEYLEDCFPSPPLRGNTPLERARVRLVSRIVDLYLVPALQPLRAALASGGGTAVLEAARTSLDTALGQLDENLGSGPFAIADQLTLADCALAPVMFYVDRLAGTLLPHYSRAKFRRLAACTNHIPVNSAVASVLALIASSLKPAGSPP